MGESGLAPRVDAADDSRPTKRLNVAAGTRSIARVRWLKTVVTILLLALWLPASTHTLLQQAGWIHTDHADADGDSDTDNDHDAADGICYVASTHVQVQLPELSGAPMPISSLDFALVLGTQLETSLAAPNGPDPPGAAPPELSHTWQFSSRASLPPRAPSLLS